MTRRVVGLDLSMTETGVAWNTLAEGLNTGVIRPRAAGDARLPEIKNRVLEVCQGAGLVVIEGYLNHSHSAGTTGMVHGAVRTGLIEAGIPYATFPPSSLKKYATGRGGASKTDMALAALKRGDREFRNNNECDAWWLSLAGTDYLEMPMIKLPADQRAALAALKFEVS